MQEVRNFDSMYRAFHGHCKAGELQEAKEVYNSCLLYDNSVALTRREGELTWTKKLIDPNGAVSCVLLIVCRALIFAVYSLE